MKKLILSIFTLTIIGLLFTSCKKDMTEAEIIKNQLAQADSLQKRGGIIKYTVKIISTANSAILKAKMSVENAVVTVMQNDSTYTVHTDANGIAYFPNMRIGTAAVNVKLKDHAEVDYITDLTPSDNLNLSSDQMVNLIRYASTMVPMFPIADPGCATITGRVTAELDLTNTTPEPAPGVKVTAAVDVSDSAFRATYLTSATSDNTATTPGRIVKFALSDATVTATTDTEGNYTLKVPAAVNGLPIKISIEDYQAQQKLYMENDPATGEFKPGVYNIPTLYSNDIEASEIPTVQTVYAVVDEPTSPVGIVKKQAKLDVVLDGNGAIVKVNVVEKGLYSNKPMIFVWGNSTSDAQLEPVFNNETGEVVDVNIIKSGAGYTNPVYAVVAIADKLQKAKVSVSTDSYGNINSATIINGGLGYFHKANIHFLSPNKEYTEPVAVCTFNWYGNLTGVVFNKYGSGYKNVVNTPVQKQPFKLVVSTIKATSNGVTTNNIYIGTGSKN